MSTTPRTCTWPVVLLAACTAKPVEHAVPVAAPAISNEASPEPAAPTAPAIPTAIKTSPEPAAAAPNIAPPLPPIVDAPLDLTALQRALGDGFSEAVEISATHPVGRELLVLARVHGARIWTAKQGDRLDIVREPLESAAEACESAGGTLDVACVLPTAGELHLAWSLLGLDVFAWDVARVRPVADGYHILARRRLYDAALMPEGEDPPKFKIYDIDNDGRSELMVIVPIQVPEGDGLESTTGQVGHILDTSDLHSQFEATRRYIYSYSDVTQTDHTAETTWFAKDFNNDTHADLQVREVVRESISSEDDPSRDTRKASRTTTCLYDQASDRWICPEVLGRQLLPGLTASAP